MSHIDTNFLREIKELVNSAKQRVVNSINIAMVYTYYEIGRRIVEQEQKGKHRVNYGNELIKQLSAELTREFGKGYSEVNLRYFRKFYIIYSVNQIQQTVFAKSKITNFKTKISFYNNSKKQIGQPLVAESKINDNYNNYPITSDGHQLSFFIKG